jgi:hypothetical protein
MLEDGNLDSMPDPQNPRGKVYRLTENSAEKVWNRQQQMKTKGA